MEQNINSIPELICCPILAEIEQINDLGRSKWYEVVYYYNNKWCSYADSETFQDGEKVIRWKYAKECF